MYAALPPPIASHWVLGPGEGPRLKLTADNDFELPPGGGAGGDVVLFVDPATPDLLHLRERPVRRGTASRVRSVISGAFDSSYKVGCFPAFEVVNIVRQPVQNFV